MNKADHEKLWTAVSKLESQVARGSLGDFVNRTLRMWEQGAADPAMKGVRFDVAEEILRNTYPVREMDALPEVYADIVRDAFEVLRRVRRTEGASPAAGPRELRTFYFTLTEGKYDYYPNLILDRIDGPLPAHPEIGISHTFDQAKAIARNGNRVIIDPHESDSKCYKSKTGAEGAASPETRTVCCPKCGHGFDVDLTWLTKYGTGAAADALRAEKEK